MRARTASQSDSHITGRTNRTNRTGVVDRAQLFAPTGPAARLAILTYGVVAYAAFLAAITYAIGFVGNWLVPKSIDSGIVGPIAQSLIINAALLSIFVAQHAIMARPTFKRWWTTIIPPAAERSTFVLAASACLGIVYWGWCPLPQVIWSIENQAIAIALNCVCLLGWAIVLYSSFLINHFDLFGLRQVWLHWRSRNAAPVGFRLVSLYKLVRHPLMLGFLIAFWAAPTMSLGRLAFALLTTAYIVLGTRMEEHDLVAQHGERYRDYQRTVPAFFPSMRRRRPTAATTTIMARPASVPGSGTSTN
ncbi:MAG: methanethiol S-methyltransferase [Phycisphaerae bacterium]